MKSVNEVMVVYKDGSTMTMFDDAAQSFYESFERFKDRSDWIVVEREKAMSVYNIARIDQIHIAYDEV